MAAAPGDGKNLAVSMHSIFPGTAIESLSALSIISCTSSFVFTSRISDLFDMLEINLSLSDLSYNGTENSL